jgi:hypothetical protein
LASLAGTIIAIAGNNKYEATGDPAQTDNPGRFSLWYESYANYLRWCAYFLTLDHSLPKIGICPNLMLTYPALATFKP